MWTWILSIWVKIVHCIFFSYKLYKLYTNIKFLEKFFSWFNQVSFLYFSKTLLTMCQGVWEPLYVWLLCSCGRSKVSMQSSWWVGLEYSHIHLHQSAAVAACNPKARSLFFIRTANPGCWMYSQTCSLLFTFNLHILCKDAIKQTTNSPCLMPYLLQ